MTFARRYLTWLLIPPALFSLPLAFIFLTQVIQFSRRDWSLVLGLVALVYGLGAALFAFRLREPLSGLAQSLSTQSRIAEAASHCLRATERASAALWLGGGALFAILGTLMTLPTFLGFSYFFVAGLIAAAPSIAWAYFQAKEQLIGSVTSGQLRYVGPELSLGKKIALVFISFFIISAAALVLLVSSRVSTTLEKLAISAEAQRFDRIRESANLSARVDRATLDTLRGYVPRGYTLYRIAKDGRMESSDPEQKDALGLDEVAAIQRLRNGDSSGFIAPHVTRFGELNDGSILVLSIPWAPFRDIPYQISFYTLIIALLTTAIFTVATFYLSRDITAPLNELRGLAAEMARGNFDRQPKIFSDDEVGALGESFRETRDKLRNLIARIGGSGAVITSGVRVITEGTDTLLNRSKEQTALTEDSSTSLGKVRQGTEKVLTAAETVTDLSQDVSSRVMELQASAEEIARSMDYLFQSVEKTSSSTTEMDAAAREMTGRTEFLASTGDEVLSFVAEMDSTIDELRTTAESTAAISRQVQQDAAAGGTAVNETMAGIQTAQESTKRSAAVLGDLQVSIGQISQILNVIEEVTGRTNLLSLNAAIIAAQAGEQGAGFTVVADEIRELADRTRGSTKEIGGIIKAIQVGSKEAARAMNEGVQRVDQNVSLARHAAESLAKIVSSANQSYDMANRISAALQEQAKASRHLHEVSSKMSEHIAQMNRATQEQARGTKLLAEEAERVREIALQVKTSTDEQSVVGRGISQAMEQIASDVRTIRDLLENQLHDTDRISKASTMMLAIAQDNDIIAQEFNETVKNLLKSGREFEGEVARFRVAEGS